MTLNPNCIRDILLFLEKELSLSEQLEFEPVDYQFMAAELSYEAAEIINTLLVLEDADFIEVASDYSSEGIEEFVVYRITYNGYQFLETIRPKTVWQKTTSVCSSIGSFSFNLLTQVATSLLTAYANGQLNL